ncbi:hypothetical protein [Acetomicrobium sp.]|uniref:hypothetical protein n=1 Tax=Acetomicrobium sp. TaxID=1872099 RepID=UPI002FC92CD6
MVRKEKIDVINSQSVYVDQPSIPNRFVAFVPQSDEAELRHLGEEISRKVREEWGQIVFKTMEGLNITCPEDKVEKQIKRFPEIYWVALPLKIGDRDIAIEDLGEIFESTEKYRDIWQFAVDNGEYSPNLGLLYQIIYSSLEKLIGARKKSEEF